MLEETVLITLAEVQKVRYITQHYDADKFAQFAREVQRVYVLPLLGNSLYADLLDNYEESNYDELLEGTTYADGDETISFYGLKLYMIYMWLYLYSKEGGVFYTESGREEFDFQETKSIKTGLASEVLNNFKSNADRIAKQVIKYLDDHTDDFDKWEVSPRETKQLKDNSFTVFGKTFHRPEV